MLHLNELLKLPIFKNFKLIAGATGLYREVRNVDILEYEWCNKNFDVFNPEDLVLTSLFFAKDEPELILKSFQKLAARNITAIAIKTVFFQDLPAEVLDFAEAEGIPLFLFNHAFMEDIIINFNDLMKTQQRHLFFEEKIHDLLTPTLATHTIEAIAREINPSFLPYVTAFYLIDKKNPGSPREIANCMNRLLYKQYRSSHLFYVSYLKYQNGLLLLYSGNDAHLAQDAWLLSQKLLSSYDINIDAFYLGVSDTLPTCTALPEAIQQSIDACYICLQTHEKTTHYQKLGFHRLLFEASRNESTTELMQQVLQILQEYDQSSKSNLLSTLMAYVQHHGEISKTAKSLYQHPNTIRYRLKKAQELLTPVLGNDDFFEQISFLLRLHHLIRTCQK